MSNAAPIIVRAPQGALASKETIGSDEIVAIAAFVVCTWIAGWALAAWLFPKKNRWDIADIIGSYALFPAIIWAAIDASITSSPTIDSRWYGSCSSGNYFFYLYCVRQILHFPFLVFGEYKPFDKAAMLLHHVLSLLRSPPPPALSAW
jgi:hypothetical protein